ncbi:endolytic transglycosylase MltG [Ferrimonas balearica]|uniref:endolytic transglycosylase MltG n=1 Tax=Ferrimonas balearica TaxID=44012 RepID=UPI001F163447|nr:endolytic transglycosylase MltG [Ferrimonas balearica]MBY6016549.1 endolytic transglycosylase MltG [Halomonas denitrificans]MBY6095180.1 endolytic transglycosylase MltG [Ferrimonas balearica]
MALKAWLKGILVASGLTITVTLAGAGFAWYQTQQAMVQPLQMAQPEEITLTRGANAGTLLADWEKAGWIDQRFWLRLALKLQPELTAIKSGTYELAPDMTVAQALALLVAGDEKQFQITLVEGGTAKQWLAQVQAHPRIQTTLDDIAALDMALGLEDQPVEGWLYPDTYAFTAGTTDLAILQRAFDQMESAVETVWAQRVKNLPIDTPYEMLILASIIEKETGKPEERRLVSSVFVNRLNKGMRLQTDPTVIYGVGEDYQGRITRKHLNTWTPYNTYRIHGLPPTPIANPSLASLQAAVNPEQSDYLYFVSKGDGSHQFSRTLREHNNAVNRYIRNR